MAFTRTWSSTTPADTDLAKNGARDMRYVRVDVKERMELEHSFAVTADDGRHLEGSARAYVQATAPTPPTGFEEGRLWLDSDTGILYVHNGTNFTTFPLLSCQYIDASIQVTDANASACRDFGITTYYHASPYTNKPADATGGGIIVTYCYDGTRAVQEWYSTTAGEEGACWKRFTSDGSTWSAWKLIGTSTYANTSSIQYIIDNGGATISTGVKGDIEIPFDCTIERVTMLADVSGSIVVDIWKDTYANYPPVDADSITASAPPTISSTTKSQDSTLTGWTKTITAGQILRFNVDSCTTITRCTISLKVKRT